MKSTSLNTAIAPIFSAIRQAGGSAYMVGGCVRDTVLGLAPKDIDIEIYGLKSEAVIEIISAFGRVNVVGQSFGVLKLTTPEGEEFDVALPRRESKTGAGYKGFTVEVDPSITIEEAASRRDLTVNAMLMAEDGEIVDLFGGQADMQNKVLRHVGPAFAEDPLRVLRIMQFAARWGFSVAPETAELAYSLKSEFSALAQERVWIEWEKLAAKGQPQSIEAGLTALVEL